MWNFIILFPWYNYTSTVVGVDGEGEAVLEELLLLGYALGISNLRK